MRHGLLGAHSGLLMAINSQLTLRLAKYKQALYESFIVSESKCFLADQQEQMLGF